jgi:hypothetical protein
MDYVFYQVAAINGFDSMSHYLRAGLILNTCSQYQITFAEDCSAKFTNGSGASARAASVKAPTATWKDKRRSDSLLALDALLHGLKPSAAASGPAPSSGTQATQPVSQPEPSATPAPASASDPAPSSAQEGLLNYLMGGSG